MNDYSIQTQFKPNLVRRPVRRLVRRSFSEVGSFSEDGSLGEGGFKRGTCAAQTFLTETLVRRSLLVRHSFSDGGSEGGCAFDSKMVKISRGIFAFLLLADASISDAATSIGSGPPVQTLQLLWCILR